MFTSGTFPIIRIYLPMLLRNIYHNEKLLFLFDLFRFEYLLTVFGPLVSYILVLLQLMRGYFFNCTIKITILMQPVELVFWKHWADPGMVLTSPVVRLIWHEVNLIMFLRNLLKQHWLKSTLLQIRKSFEPFQTSITFAILGQNVDHRDFLKLSIKENNCSNLNNPTIT